jgi:hypothetical protein
VIVHQGGALQEGVSARSVAETGAVVDCAVVMASGESLAPRAMAFNIQGRLTASVIGSIQPLQGLARGNLAHPPPCPNAAHPTAPSCPSPDTHPPRALW